MPPPPPTDLLDFSAAEWRVIFPTAPPPSAGAPFADRLTLAADGDSDNPFPGGDKHAGADQSDPITYEKWVEAASKRGGGWFAFQERAIRTLSPWMALNRTWFPPVIHVLGVLCVMPFPFFLDFGGTFGRTQLIAGTVNLGIAVVVGNLAFTVVVTSKTRNAPRACDIHLFVVQQLFRLWQLQKDSGSILIAHVDGDPLCPCDECARPLVRWIPWERLLRSFAQQISTLLYMLLMGWTALVYLGGSVWPKSWGATLGAFSLFAILQYNLPAFFAGFVPANDPLVRIGTRIYRRATYLGLSSFLIRAAAALTDPAFDSEILPARELFVELHRGYSIRWSACGVNPITSLLSFAFPMAILLLIIAVSTGSCIPGWILSYFVWVPLFVVLGLFEIPSINGQMDAITELYRGAHLSLVSLLSESAGLPATPEREAARDRLRARAALLHALTGSAEHHRIKFAGLPVTYGLAKTIAVTLLTLVVGCWSILRGFGVYVTLQTYCPTPA
ncbi:hypothetical protein DFJ74DRAFT_442925 [Hyaloraphidium curvatum]|nr:hypothetical protein DFJ74DRAFT_442925 [Hyaloraphidium curvatum]